MSEVPLYPPRTALKGTDRRSCPTYSAHMLGMLQGYLAHKQPRAPRTLPYDYA